MGCRPDTGIAKWEIEALSPIISSRIEVEDMLHDSVRSVNSDGDVSLIYRKQLANFKFDRITQGFNKSFFNTVNLDNIELGSRTVQNSLSLGQLAAKAGVLGAVIIANNGQKMVVPPIYGIGPETFRFDASEYFQTITLDDGWLYVYIENHLPLELNNIQYTIENQSGGTPIATRSIAMIPAQSSHLDSIQLNNRVTIEGRLKAILQNVDSPGSNGDSIHIDTSQVIDVTVTLTRLEPYSATAIFPDQTLLRDTTNTEIDNFNGELTRMHVGSGKIYIDASSTIEDEIIFDYIIPSASQNGSIMSFQEKVPPAPAGGHSTQYSEKDLTGFDVDLTGRPGDVGVYNTFYTITNGRIDSSGRLINLSLTDSVYLETGIMDLIASRGYGYLGKDTLESETDSKLDLLGKIRDGEIDFAEVALALEIENYIGAPLEMVVNSVNALGRGQPKPLQWGQLGNSLNITRATENTPGSKPTPGILRLDLNESNSNIDEIIEYRPSKLGTSLTAWLNSSLSSPDYSQFAYLDYGLQAWLSAEVPLHLSARNIFFRDTASFRYEDLDPDGRLRSGKLMLIADNNFPFGMDVDILLMDTDSTIIDTLSSSDIIEPAKTDDEGRAVEKVKSTATYPLDPASIDQLKQTYFIVFEAKFHSADYPEYVRIQENDHMDLTLSGDLKVNSR